MKEYFLHTSTFLRRGELEGKFSIFVCFVLFCFVLFGIVGIFGEIVCILHAILRVLHTIGLFYRLCRLYRLYHFLPSSPACRVGTLSPFSYVWLLRAILSGSLRSQYSVFLIGFFVRRTLFHQCLHNSLHLFFRNFLPTLLVKSVHCSSFHTM